MSDSLSAWAPLAWAQLWQVTVVALVALLVARAFCRYRPHLAYALLLVVLFKCLTPPIWSSPVGVFAWTWHMPSGSVPAVEFPTVGPAADVSLEQGQATVPVPAADITTATVAQATPTSKVKTIGIAESLLLAWACGAVACAAFVTATWLRHLGAIRKTSAPASKRLAALSQQLAATVGLKRRVRLLVSSDSYGPSCFGVVFPFVVLPDRLVEEGAADEQRSGPHANIEPILAHELTHIRRGDNLAAMFQVIAWVVWWFHPLVWLVSRQLSREREKCCDEEVLARTACDPEKYAQGMLDVLKLRRPLAPAFLSSGLRPVDITKERLEAIMSRRCRWHARTPYFCWMVLLVGGMLVLPGATAVPSASGETGAESVDVESPTAEPKIDKFKLNSLRFGKVMERTVYDDVPGFRFLIDFDNGKVFSPPKDFQPHSFKEALEWFRKKGVDAMGEGDYLLGIDMIALPTSRPNWTDLHPRIFNQIEAATPGTPIPISGHGKLPSTYLFKTREGGRGVLQIIEFTPSEGDDRPGTTKLRYKLLDAAKEEGSKVAADPRKWGTLRGRFSYVGQPPAPKPINVTTDSSVFGALGIVDESLLVSDDSGIANVVVFLRTADARVRSKAEELLNDLVILKEKDGQLTPRVLTLCVPQQTLLITNSSPTATNVHFAPSRNSAFNMMLKPGDIHQYSPKRAESLPQLVSCNVHPWMRAYFVVRDNPYVAISRPDGTFRIEHLPAGPLEFQVWHERSGPLQVRNWDKGRFKVSVVEGDNDLGTIDVPARLLDED